MQKLLVRKILCSGLVLEQKFTTQDHELYFFKQFSCSRIKHMHVCLWQKFELGYFFDRLYAHHAYCICKCGQFCFRDFYDDTIFMKISPLQT